jgi:hypothetical protein
LQQEGTLKRIANPEPWAEGEENGHVVALDDIDEKNTFWFIGNKHWYLV